MIVDQSKAHKLRAYVATLLHCLLSIEVEGREDRAVGFIERMTTHRGSAGVRDGGRAEAKGPKRRTQFF